MRKKTYTKKYFISVKNLTSLLLLAVVILLGIIVYVVISKHDAEAPVISCESEAVFLSDVDVENVMGKDYSCLLEGITAQDNKDGDVTDRIIVYSTKVDPSNVYMTVDYKVMDLAGNVENYRRMAYIKAPSEIHELLQEKLADNLNMDITEIKALMGEEADATNVDLAIEEGAPQLAMETEVTVTRNSFFNPLSYIIDLKDDIDSAEYLLSHGHVEGNVDIQTPGTYALTFYVTDSDGNNSNSVTVHVTVVE